MKRWWQRKRVWVPVAVIALAWLYSWRSVTVVDGPITVRGSVTPVAPFMVRATATVTNTSDGFVDIIPPCRNEVEIDGIGWFTTGPRCYNGRVSLEPGETRAQNRSGILFCVIADCSVRAGYRDATGDVRKVRARLRILSFL